MARNKQESPEIKLFEFDTLQYIQPKSVYLGAVSLYEFCSVNGAKIAKDNSIPIGQAFERFCTDFDKESITDDPTKGSAKETWLRKSGLLSSESGEYKLSPIGERILNKTLPLDCFAFLLLTKQWIKVKPVNETVCYKKNLLVHLLSLFSGGESYTEEDFKAKARQSALELYKAEYENLKFANEEGERYILPPLYMSGFFEKVDGKIQLSPNYKHLADLMTSNEQLFKSPSDAGVSEEYFFNSFEFGIYDILTDETASIIYELYPGLQKGVNSPGLTGPGFNLLIYGAPGTGKSYTVDQEYIKSSKSFRVTFHPDTDYASFVGCYKPHTIETQEGAQKKGKVVYGFQKQVFLEAYVEAWNALKNKEKVFLVVGEINRGNCAQIFGDLFQLLDRRVDGYSKYTINADKDIELVLRKEIPGYKDLFLKAYPDKAGDWKDNLMALPTNLVIIATMNTSDQSLFPMDSAFKRRWETEYFPIQYSDADSARVVFSSNVKYSWGAILRILNAYIKKETESANKTIGNRFIDFERTGKEIDIKTFRDKVIFFLFNDVFKDNESFAKTFFGSLYRNPCYFFEDLYEQENWREIIEGFLKDISGDFVLQNIVQEMNSSEEETLANDNQEEQQ